MESLPKLHRSESLRNAYLGRSLKGVYQPLDGSPAEIIVGRSKLHSSFPDSTTFFSAWQIYMSIHCEYRPEMGTRLNFWTEYLLYLVHFNYPWPAILEYIIAYFQTYQNRTDEEAWFDPNPNLMNYHVLLVQQRPQPPAPNSAASTTSTKGIATKRNTKTSSRPRPNSQRLESMATEVCITHNNPSGCQWRDNEGGGCPRRHVCITCLSAQHTASTCPSKVKAPK